MADGTLARLYAAHTGKVSDKWSSYLRQYDSLFSPLRDRPVRLLEIGVQNGGSLEIWAKYFAAGQVLLGCDIDPKCAGLAYDDPRIAVVIGDATAPETAAQVAERCPAFDIVIDDGSHASRHVIQAFVRYFPRLADGGLYVVEDLHCSYWDRFGGGLFDPYSSIAFFKRLVDVLNHEHWGIERAPGDILDGLLSRHGCQAETDFLAGMHSVEFINSMCVIRKASAAENTLGRQIVGGSDESVVPGRKRLHEQPYGPAFDQVANPWSACRVPPDEAFAQVEEMLASAHGRVAALDGRNADLSTQIAALRQRIGMLEREKAALESDIGSLRQKQRSMERRNAELQGDLARLRNSASWRLTAPLRAALSGMRALFGRS